MVDVAGDVARTMEGLNVGADVAMTMIELTQQKNVLFNQVEEMAKQDWVGYEEEHAQFDNQILDIHKKLADLEKGKKEIAAAAEVWQKWQTSELNRAKKVDHNLIKIKHKD